MNMNEIQEEFFNHSIRTELVLHLGTQCLDDDSWPATVKDAFDMDFDQIFKALGICPPEEDEDEICMLGNHLRNHNKTGYLIQFATPIPTSFTEHSYSTIGWGYCIMYWIYSDTYEDACEAAIKWKHDYIDRERNKMLI